MKLTAEQIEYLIKWDHTFEEKDLTSEDLYVIDVWKYSVDKSTWVIRLKGKVDTDEYKFDVPYSILNDDQKEELDIYDEALSEHQLKHGYLRTLYNDNLRKNIILKKVDDYLHECGAIQNTHIFVFEQTWHDGGKGFDIPGTKEIYTKSLVIVLKDFEHLDYYVFSDGELLYKMHSEELTWRFESDIYNKSMASQKEYKTRYSEMIENQ